MKTNNKVAIIETHSDNESIVLAKKLAEMHIEADIVELAEVRKEALYIDIPYSLAPYVALAKALEPRPSKSEIRRGCSNGHSYKAFYNEENEGYTTTTWVCSKCGKPM